MMSFAAFLGAGGTCFFVLDLNKPLRTAMDTKFLHQKRVFFCINSAADVVENDSSIPKWGRLHHNSTHSQRYDLRPTGAEGRGESGLEPIFDYFYRL